MCWWSLESWQKEAGLLSAAKDLQRFEVLEWGGRDDYSSKKNRIT